MFSVGSIYKINIDIPLWSHSFFGKQDAAEWAKAGCFMIILDMKSDFFIIHTHLGMFRSSNFNNYANFRVKFTKIA